MVKKVGIAALAVAAALFVVSHTRFGSYVNVSWNKMRACAGKQVPIEFEIERIRNEVAQLVPDMNKHLSAIAEEKVQIESLKDEIATVRINLKQQKENILTMTRDLESNNEQIVYDGRPYSKTRIKEKLDRDFASYKRADAEMKSREQLLDAKERSLGSALDQLASMRDQKRELEVSVAQLEADLKAVRLEQTKSKFQLDDSRLAQIKASLADIRSRLRGEQIEAELKGQFASDNSIPVEKKSKSTTEVTKEVRDYFNDKTDTKVADNK
jgi:chromosome segregation ATPase